MPKKIKQPRVIYRNGIKYISTTNASKLKYATYIENGCWYILSKEKNAKT